MTIMKYLYYCGSAYQVMNAVSLHFGFMQKREDYSADIWIQNSFVWADRIATVLAKDSLFDSVKLVNRYNTADAGSGVFSIHYNTLRDILLPKKMLLQKQGINSSTVVNRYTVLFVSSFNRTTAAVWQLNRKAELIYFDDGMASYYGTFIDDRIPKLYKAIYPLFCGGNRWEASNQLYLNWPELYCGDTKKKVLKLPRVDDARLDILKKKLEAEDDKIKQNKYRIIWLAQILKDSQNAGLLNSIGIILDQYREDVLVRRHPRDTEDSWMQFETDDRHSIWEIKALGIPKIEDRILVSFYSTAAFSVKLLYDKEPYLILAYKLLKGSDRKESEEFDKILFRLKSIYRNPSKIMVPQTIEDFDNCLKQYYAETVDFYM